jgi:hypothetical protein
MKQTAITESYQKPAHDEIALAAYLAWEKDGRPVGRDQQYWQQAEAELCQQRRAAAASVAKAKRNWPAARVVATAPAKLKKLTGTVRKAATAGKAIVSRKRKTGV